MGVRLLFEEESSESLILTVKMFPNYSFAKRDRRKVAVRKLAVVFFVVFADGFHDAVVVLGVGRATGFPA